MKTQRLALALTVLNLLLLLVTVTRARSTTAQAATRVLRGQALELVDARGQVRSRLNAEAEGEVVLRLMDSRGTIRVKLGAGEGGSGLVLMDEATEPAVHLVARRAGVPGRPATTGITLQGADGRRRVIAP